eukprot:1155986-Pelagomonas_calceolata.AAC.1
MELTNVRCQDVGLLAEAAYNQLESPFREAEIDKFRGPGHQSSSTSQHAYRMNPQGPPWGKVQKSMV